MSAESPLDTMTFQQNQYQQNQFEVAKPNGALAAWGHAISQTGQLIKPIFSSDKFIPLSFALITAYYAMKDEGKIPCIPLILICGASAIVGKFVPYIVLPVSGVYLALRKR